MDRTREWDAVVSERSALKRMDGTPAMSHWRGRGGRSLLRGVRASGGSVVASMLERDDGGPTTGLHDVLKTSGKWRCCRTLPLDCRRYDVVKRALNHGASYMYLALRHLAVHAVCTGSRLRAGSVR